MIEHQFTTLFLISDEKRPKYLQYNETFKLLKSS